MKPLLQADKLLKTVKSISGTIEERFPKAGISLFAGEVVEITSAALDRAKDISRPIYWVRAAQVLLLLIAVVGVVTYLETRDDQRPFWKALVDFLDAAKGSAAILGATAIFLYTLETRLKRRRALKAIHELRAMAHIIDMHQLTKDPDLIGHINNPVVVGKTLLDAEGMGRYLHFCTELLAILSKIGQLYVQNFPDAAAQSAVDNFESLATGLSSKIWQKLMILDRIRSEPGSARSL